MKTTIIILSIYLVGGLVSLCLKRCIDKKEGQEFIKYHYIWLFLLSWIAVFAALDGINKFNIK